VVHYTWSVIHASEGQQNKLHNSLCFQGGGRQPLLEMCAHGGCMPLFQRIYVDTS